MAKKKKGPVVKKGLDEWMATYADMVTLLLCFFVLLYASSTQDETKIQYIFQEFVNGGRFLNTIIGKDPETPIDADVSGPNNSDLPPIFETDNDLGGDSNIGAGEDPDSFTELYNAIQQAIQSSEFSETVSVDGNGGQIRIRLDDGVMFAPDNHELTNSGRKILGILSPSIKATGKFIESVIVHGHTAKVPGYSVVNDWDLSGLRASSVIKYFEYTATVATDKLKLEAFGSNVPIDDGDTPEARARNRRVEIVINRNKELAKNDLFLDIMEFDYNQHFYSIDEEGNRIDNNFLNKDDVIQRIADAIDSRYGNKEGNDAEVSQAPVGPSANGILISENDYLPPEEIPEQSQVTE